MVGGLAAFATSAIGALTSLQGCSKEAPKPSSPDPIVIGVSLGLSNDLGSFTAPLRDAVRTAEGEINAGGGLLGRPVRFEVVDDKSDEGDGVRKVIQGFADKNVVGVIGPVSSGQVKSTQDVLAGKQIIQITPSATSVELEKFQDKSDRFLFRTTPADDFQGAAVMLFAARTPRGLSDAGAPAVGDGGVQLTTACNRLAIVYIDNSYGSSMTDVISKNFTKRGVGRQIVSQNKIPLEAAASYADKVGPIIDSNPECLAIISYEKAAAQFIKDFKVHPKYPALRDAGFFFIGTDGVFTQGFLEESRADKADDTSASTAEGVYGTNPDTQPGTSDYNAFRTLYSSYFPLKTAEDAPAFAANTFDAAILIAFAIQKVGNINDRAALRDAIKEVSRPPGRPISPSEIAQGLIELREGKEIDYKGASGNVNLQDNGNVTSGFIIWQAVRDQANKVVYKTVARFDSDQLQEQIIE
jgi:ABC-type branched-subunit amino acid transport system substrate-binding protein